MANRWVARAASATALTLALIGGCNAWKQHVPRVGRDMTLAQQAGKEQQKGLDNGMAKGPEFPRPTFPSAHLEMSKDIPFSMPAIRGERSGKLLSREGLERLIVPEKDVARDQEYGLIEAPIGSALAYSRETSYFTPKGLYAQGDAGTQRGYTHIIPTDALIILDVSSSMADARIRMDTQRNGLKVTLSLPAVMALSISQHYVDMGSKVSAILFSGRTRPFPFTDDIFELANEFTQFEDSGTDLDYHALAGFLAKNTSNLDVYLLSDDGTFKCSSDPGSISKLMETITNLEAVVGDPDRSRIFLIEWRTKTDPAKRQAVIDYLNLSNVYYAQVSDEEGRATKEGMRSLSSRLEAMLK